MSELETVFRSPARRAKATCCGIVGTMGLSLLGMIFSGRTIAMLDRLDADPELPTDEATIYLLMAGGLALCALLVFPFTAVSFCMWFYRVNRNARAFDQDGMTRSAGWAVGSFFVPFANLVVPYKSMREVWRASEPDSEGADDAKQPVRLESVVGWWWFFWVTGGIADRVSSRLSMRAETNEALRLAEWLSIGGNVLLITAGVFCISVVRAVTRMQVAKASALGFEAGGASRA